MRWGQNHPSVSLPNGEWSLPLLPSPSACTQHVWELKSLNCGPSPSRLFLHLSISYIKFRISLSIFIQIFGDSNWRYGRMTEEHGRLPMVSLPIHKHGDSSLYLNLLKCISVISYNFCVNVLHIFCQIYSLVYDLLSCYKLYHLKVLNPNCLLLVCKIW